MKIFATLLLTAFIAHAVPTQKEIKVATKPKQQNVEVKVEAVSKPVEMPKPAPVVPITTQAQTPVVAAPVAPQGDAKVFIYMKESGNNPGAINPSSGACGLGQALPCSKMPCSLSDYACQDNFFTQYMLNRYGSWENARSFWLSHKWW